MGSEGLHTSKSECQAYEGKNCRASASTAETYTINLGTTPEYILGLTGVPPSGGAPGKAGARGKWACGRQAGVRNLSRAERLGAGMGGIRGCNNGSLILLTGRQGLS
jgi:hypothetical protein